MSETFHIVETDKNVDQAVADLTAAAAERGYGVLHVHDLRAKMAEKGVAFPCECRVLEVCNPRQAAAVLEADMRISLALPCRVCVFEQDGRTRIGALRPAEALAVFSPDAELREAAAQVERDVLAMIEAAR